MCMPTALQDLWQHLQRQLFPLLLEEVGELGEKDYQFVEVVALLDAGNRVGGEVRSGKDVLPGKLFEGGGVFALEGVGKVDGPIAVEQILIVLGFDSLKLDAKRFAQEVGEDGEAVILAFAVADDDLPVVKVEVFDAQAQDFHETESAPVHKLGHEAIDAVHFGDGALGFAFG